MPIRMYVHVCMVTVHTVYSHWTGPTKESQWLGFITNTDKTKNTNTDTDTTKNTNTDTDTTKITNTDTDAICLKKIPKKDQASCFMCLDPNSQKYPPTSKNQSPTSSQSPAAAMKWPSQDKLRSVWGWLRIKVNSHCKCQFTLTQWRRMQEKLSWRANSSSLALLCNLEKESCQFMNKMQPEVSLCCHSNVLWFHQNNATREPSPFFGHQITVNHW